MMLATLLCALTLGAGPNLVPNPGFESGGQGWSIPEGIMRVDDTAAHSGKCSLRFSWDDPGKRKLAIADIPCRPGKRYLLQAWLKSSNVHGAYKGATFGVEWGSKDAFIGGAYPMGIGWDTEWTQVSFLSGVVPKEAAWAHVFVTMDWSGVGTAWADDISVTEVDAPEVFTCHASPDTVVGDRDSGPIAVTVDRIAPEVFGEDVDVSVSLCSPPWNHALKEQKVPAQSGARLVFDTSRLNEGVYKLSAIIKSRKSGRELIEPTVLTVYKRPPMQCLLVPHSEVLVAGSGSPAVEVRPYASGTVSGHVIGPDRKVMARIGPANVMAGRNLRLTVDGPALLAGRYEARLALNSAGRTRYHTTIPFTVLSAEEAAQAVTIGPDNLLRDRGKPWFPLLFYAHTACTPTGAEAAARDPKITADLLDHLAGSPFGVLDYATPMGGLDATVAFADECARRGIRLALSVKDLHRDMSGLAARMKGFPGQSPEQAVRALAQRLRNHPAMALWYTNDELGTEYYDSLVGMRELLHQEDPLHPTLSVHYDLECIRELACTYDIFGPELYPWPSDDLKQMAEWSDRVTSSLPATAPFWGCLWAFREEPQAAEKQRALTYLAIARGARGLLFYSYFDLKAGKNFDTRWPEMLALGREVEARLPILTQPEALYPCRTSTPGIVLRTVSGNRGTWLLVVNSGKAARDAVIETGAQVRQAVDGQTSLPVSAGRLALKLEGFGVRLLRLE